MEDAEYAMVIIGSSAGTAKDAVDELRAQGVKAGLIKVRVYRPFPGEEIAAALKNVKAVAIMDKAESFSDIGGPLGADVRASMFGVCNNVKAINFVYGLGGRDVKVDDIKCAFGKLEEVVKTDAIPTGYQYLGVRE